MVCGTSCVYAIHSPPQQIQRFNDTHTVTCSVAAKLDFRPPPVPPVPPVPTIWERRQGGQAGTKAVEWYRPWRRTPSLRSTNRKHLRRQHCMKGETSLCVKDGCVRLLQNIGLLMLQKQRPWLSRSIRLWGHVSRCRRCASDQEQGRCASATRCE